MAIVAVPKLTGRLLANVQVALSPAVVVVKSGAPVSGIVAPPVLVTPSTEIVPLQPTERK